MARRTMARRTMARRTMARRTVTKPELIVIIVCAVFGLRQYNLIRTFFFTEVSSQNDAGGVDTNTRSSRSSSSRSLPRQCTIEELGVIKRQLPPDDCVEYATQPWTQRCSLSYATRCKTNTQYDSVNAHLIIMNRSCSYSVFLFLSLNNILYDVPNRLAYTFTCFRLDNLSRLCYSSPSYCFRSGGGLVRKALHCQTTTTTATTTNHAVVVVVVNNDIPSLIRRM